MNRPQKCCHKVKYIYNNHKMKKIVLKIFKPEINFEPQANRCSKHVNFKHVLVIV